MPVVFAHTRLVSQLVVTQLSGWHHRCHIKSCVEVILQLAEEAIKSKYNIGKALPLSFAKREYRARYSTTEEGWDTIRLLYQGKKALSTNVGYRWKELSHGYCFCCSFS